LIDLTIEEAKAHFCLLKIMLMEGLKQKETSTNHYEEIVEVNKYAPHFLKLLKDDQNIMFEPFMSKR